MPEGKSSPSDLLGRLKALPWAKIWRGLGVVRAVVLVLAIVWAADHFLDEVKKHYPVEHWLFWIYAEVWGWCLAFVAGSFSLGNLLAHWWLPREWPLRERLVYTSALGILAFFALLFGAGLVGLLTPTFSVALPLVSVAVGSPLLLRRYRRVVRHLRAARRRPQAARPWWHLPVLAFGLFGLGMVYFAILSPRNIAFDAHFYHLGLAQQYAVEGAIRPAAEGWLPAALPQLASVLYSWCFTLPRFDMFQRIVCAAHLELVIFLFTLAAIPVLVRWLVPRARAELAWVAMFLFPGLLVYDSSLTTAADHIAAFWAVPIFLALRRTWNEPTPRRGALLAAMLAGVLLCKYQAMYVIAFPLVAVAVRVLWLSLWALIRRHDAKARARALSALATSGVSVVVGLVLTAPHWLKNWLWYGNPLFPYLHRFFPPTRWVPDAAQLFEDWSRWQLERWVYEEPDKFREGLKTLAYFSVEPHDWPNFHGAVPVFGSLFTASVVILPFVRGARRTWALLVAGHIGLFIWFWTMHQDRYLQILLPWMACTVAATIALVWRSHIAAKLALAALVGLQIVWGGDAYFIPAHAMTKKSAAVTSASLLGEGYKKKYDKRLEVWGPLFAIGRDPAVPEKARVLIHEHNPRLGVWRPMVSDLAGYQYALRYELLESPAAMNDKLHALGVTHILAPPAKSKAMDALGADLRFFDFIHQDAKVTKDFKSFTLFALPEQAPADLPHHSRVAYLGCDKLYERGLHELRDLAYRAAARYRNPPVVEALESGADAEILAKADYAVTDSRCKPPPAATLSGFIQLATRARETLYARKR